MFFYKRVIIYSCNLKIRFRGKVVKKRIFVSNNKLNRITKISRSIKQLKTSHKNWFRSIQTKKDLQGRITNKKPGIRVMIKSNRKKASLIYTQDSRRSRGNSAYVQQSLYCHYLSINARKWLSQIKKLDITLRWLSSHKIISLTKKGIIVGYFVKTEQET